MDNSLRLEPRRRTDGTGCLMEDSEHEEIQVNLKNALQTRGVFAETVHAWPLHGSRCLHTHDMPVQINGFDLCLNMNAFQCWNWHVQVQVHSSISAASPLGSQAIALP